MNFKINAKERRIEFELTLSVLGEQAVAVVAAVDASTASVVFGVSLVHGCRRSSKLANI